MDIVAAASAFGPKAAAGAAAAVGVAAVLAAVLPPAAPGSKWAPWRALLDRLAFNVGSAANAPK